MRKSRTINKRPKLPDPIYHSVLVEQLIKQVMRKGKKNLAQAIVYQALNLIEKKSKTNKIEVLNLAIENIKPKLEVRSRKVGGAKYQIPIQVKKERQIALALRWLVEAAKKRTEKEFISKLAEEILAASNKAGSAMKKRNTIHKTADANKAFAYYSW